MGKFWVQPGVYPSNLSLDPVLLVLSQSPLLSQRLWTKMETPGQPGLPAPGPFYWRAAQVEATVLLWLPLAPEGSGGSRRRTTGALTALYGLTQNGVPEQASASSCAHRRNGHTCRVLRGTRRGHGNSRHAVSSQEAHPEELLGAQAEPQQKQLGAQGRLICVLAWR